jgi:hypothetical protein
MRGARETSSTDNGPHFKVKIGSTKYHVLLFSNTTNQLTKEHQTWPIFKLFYKKKGHWFLDWEIIFVEFM